jgi:addiction module HigA family antidote
LGDAGSHPAGAVIAALTFRNPSHLNKRSAIRHIDDRPAPNFERRRRRLSRRQQFVTPTPRSRAVLKDIKDLDMPPPHPGEILREDMLPRLRLGADGLAVRLGVPTDAITDLLDERRPVTIDIATRLAAAFGHSVRFWLGLQTQYDRWLACGTKQTA